MMTPPCVSEVREVLPRFTGHIMQVPPVYSAVKVDGKRAYKYARKGAEVELKAKPLVIEELEMLPSELPELRLRIVCSKGTYIRALTRDIGKALGSGAHLTALCRTRVGDVRIEDCLSVDRAVEEISNCEVTYPDDFQLKTKEQTQ